MEQTLYTGPLGSVVLYGLLLPGEKDKPIEDQKWEYFAVIYFDYDGDKNKACCHTRKYPDKTDAATVAYRYAHELGVMGQDGGKEAK